MNQSTTTAKNNIKKFSEDVSRQGGYEYTTSSSLSTRLANTRMLKGITEIRDFSGLNILDLGCGDGVCTLDLARFGVFSILGIDPVENAIESASQRAEANGFHNVTFKVGNIYELDFDRYFDCVIFRGVLHHLPDARVAIKKAAKYASEMIILEPNGFNFGLKLIEKFSQYHIDHEEQSFFPSTVIGWCENAGLKLRALKYINLVPIFCPHWFASFAKFLEPAVEATPGVRNLLCGQYVIWAVKE